MCNKIFFLYKQTLEIIIIGLLGSEITNLIYIVKANTELILL